MRTLNQRYTVACVLFAVVAPLVFYFNSRVPPPPDVGNIAKFLPETLGKWKLLDERIGGTPDEREILQTDAILTRTYSCGTVPAFELSIVHAEDNPNAIHPPELCYKGSGWTETPPRDTIALPASGGVHLLNRRHFLRGDGRRMWVLYWFKAGSKNTPRYAGFWLAALRARLFGSGCPCALVQVRAEFDASAPASEVLAELQKFAAVATPAIEAAIP
ncbi:MAG: EpsI family protein [Planctomycetes bacterium]|nr:EpsI family protein [Planctomycetota bacterium]